MGEQRKAKPLIVKIFQHAAYVTLGCGCIYVAARGENPMAGMVALHFLMKGLEEPAVAAVGFVHKFPERARNLNQRIREHVGNLPHGWGEAGAAVYGFGIAIVDRQRALIRSFVQAGRDLTSHTKSALGNIRPVLSEYLSALKETFLNLRAAGHANNSVKDRKAESGAKVIPFPRKAEDHYPTCRSGSFFRRRGAQQKCKPEPAREDLQPPAASSRLLENSV